ncbi:AI-2E family transporter [Selenomonadales bacterium OttesenSCG-928-I06]|nr:AI-2E family transporter [Selenomonadales bacterium OttesenSCG-928-I06]
MDFRRDFLFYLKTIIVIIAIYIASQVSAVFLPIALAVILSFFLNPLVNFLGKINIPFKGTHYNIPRGISILISFLIFALIILLIMTFILFPFTQELNKFSKELPELLKKIHPTILFLDDQYNSVHIPESIRAYIDSAFSEATAYAMTLAKRLLNNTLTFASRIIELIIVPVLTYYFLKDGNKIKTALISPFPNRLRSRVRTVYDEIGVVIGNYIHGQIIICIVIGMIVFSGMYILGVDYPLLLGLFATLTEAIPIIGPIMGAIPAILLAYLISPVLALKVTLFYLIIHQVESQIIVPKIMGNTISLHPVVIILSLLIGAHLGGIIGMIIAVPLTAILRVVLKHIWSYNESF